MTMRIICFDDLEIYIRSESSREMRSPRTAGGSYAIIRYPLNAYTVIIPRKEVTSWMSKPKA